MYTPYELIWLSLLLFYFFFDFILCFAIGRIKSNVHKHNHNRPLSVIIAAKNESQNLKNNLPYVLNQNYPQFEVIIVNDQSQDDTLEVLKQFEEQYQFLKCFSVKSSIKSSKKNALDLGIQHA